MSRRLPSRSTLGRSYLPRVGSGLRVSRSLSFTSRMLTKMVVDSAEYQQITNSYFWASSKSNPAAVFQPDTPSDIVQFVSFMSFVPLRDSCACPDMECTVQAMERAIRGASLSLVNDVPVLISSHRSKLPATSRRPASTPPTSLESWSTWAS